MLITTSFFVFFLAVCEARPVWRSASYLGNPTSETNVGGVIFDPLATPECYNTTGTIVISLVSCPFNANYFSVSGNKVQLATQYSLISYSAVVPDCLLACNDSTGVAAFTALTIQMLGANTRAPVWSNSFPTSINLTSLEPLQFLLDTPATDADIDKTTDGRVTYSVTTMDGAVQAADYFIYENGGNSSRLNLANPPPWSLGSPHTLVITAKDNPRTGTPNVISKTISIYVSATAITVTGVTQPTTTISTSTTSTQSSSTEALSTTVAAQVASSTTSSSCSGVAVLSCDNNWVWLVVGIGGLLLVAGGGLALGLYLRHKKQKSSSAVSPSPSQQRSRPPTYNTSIRGPNQQQYSMWPQQTPQNPNYNYVGVAR